MSVDQLARDLEEAQRRITGIGQLAPAVLSRSYAPGKWDGYRVLAHLADSQLVFLYRFSNVVAEHEKPIVPMDQDRWMEALAGARRPAEVSLAELRGLHAAWIHQLRSQDDEALRRATMHPERGRMTALDITDYGVRHLFHHLSQLEAIRDGQTWTPRPWP